MFRTAPLVATPRHCEERSDAAIQFHPLTFFRRIDQTKNKTPGLPRRLRLLAMTDAPLESIRPAPRPSSAHTAPLVGPTAQASRPPKPRHCEERSDAAIQFHPLTFFRRISQTKNKTPGLPRRLRLLAMTDGPLESIRPTRAPRRPAPRPSSAHTAPLVAPTAQASRPPKPRHCEERSDAAIQFHPLTTGAPHQPNEKQNPWIATSAAPPRNDGRAAGIHPPHTAPLAATTGQPSRIPQTPSLRGA